MNNLKPCAHCGSLNVERSTLEATISPTGREVYTCSCLDCGMCTAGFAMPEDADAAWNQRVKEN